MINMHVNIIAMEMDRWMDDKGKTKSIYLHLHV